MKLFNYPVSLRKLPLYTFLGMYCINSTYADFIDDSQKTIYLRNFYMERDFSDVPNKNIGSWSQAISGKFESGYTNTPLQLGLDLGAQYALRLTDHNAERVDTVFPYNANAGKQERDYLKVGATVKLKYQDSELKLGELYPRLPVIYIDDSRQLLTSYAGALFETKAIKNLKFSAGRITHINSREDDSYEKLSLFVGNGPRYESDGLNFVGLDYNFNPYLTGSYWYGQLEDIYQQHYLNTTYSQQIDKTKLKVDARYFHNSKDGDAYYGKIDSQTYGVQAALQQDAHSLVVGIQKNKGDSNFPTLAGYAPQPYLHTWSTLGFIKPEELTWHILYSHDFKKYDFPGLKMTLRYLNGSHIQRPGLKDNQESEANFILSYLVPEGTFKGLGFEWRHIRTQSKYGTGYTPGPDFIENRFITTYSYKF